MNILVIGARGFIGRAVCAELLRHGYEVTGLSRHPGNSGPGTVKELVMKQWDGHSAEDLKILLKGIDAVINLSGENIGKKRWTNRRKQKLEESRTGLAGTLTRAILQSKDRPELLIQASAAGYYGAHPQKPVDESSPAGNDYLSKLSQEWELAVSPLVESGLRVVMLRNGIILGRNGGIMKRLMMPFAFYAGALPGNGNQWLSWIHLEDEVRAIRFLLENPQCSGPFNMVSPNPSAMKELIAAIARTTGKPAWLKVPDWALIAIYGEMARETILSSQRIVPKKLMDYGFEFMHADLENTIKDILSVPKK